MGYTRHTRCTPLFEVLLCRVHNYYQQVSCLLVNATIIAGQRFSSVTQHPRVYGIRRLAPWRNLGVLCKKHLNEHRWHYCDHALATNKWICWGVH